MAYNSVSESINKRYNRLSESESAPETKLPKNQEESASTLQMSEHEMPPTPIKPEQEKKQARPESKMDSILLFWSKYKFWIIALLALFFFLLLIIGIFHSKKPSKSESIEAELTKQMATQAASNQQVVSKLNQLFSAQPQATNPTSPPDSGVKLPETTIMSSTTSAVQPSPVQPSPVQPTPIKTETKPLFSFSSLFKAQPKPIAQPPTPAVKPITMTPPVAQPMPVSAQLPVIKPIVSTTPTVVQSAPAPMIKPITTIPIAPVTPPPVTIPA